LFSSPMIKGFSLLRTVRASARGRSAARHSPAASCASPARCSDGHSPPAPTACVGAALAAASLRRSHPPRLLTVDRRGPRGESAAGVVRQARWAARARGAGDRTPSTSRSAAARSARNPRSWTALEALRPGAGLGAHRVRVLAITALRPVVAGAAGDAREGGGCEQRGEASAFRGAQQTRRRSAVAPH
jgi:hypothetical protein